MKIYNYNQDKPIHTYDIKRFSVTLQVFNSRLITQAYLLLLDKGGGNLERDFSSARAFEMYGWLN